MNANLIAPNLALTAELDYEARCKCADEIADKALATITTPNDLRDLVEDCQPEIYGQLTRMIQNNDRAIREVAKIIHTMPYLASILECVSQIERELYRHAEKRAENEL